MKAADKKEMINKAAEVCAHIYGDTIGRGNSVGMDQIIDGIDSLLFESNGWHAFIFNGHIMYVFRHFVGKLEVIDRKEIKLAAQELYSKTKERQAKESYDAETRTLDAFYCLKDGQILSREDYTIAVVDQFMGPLGKISKNTGMSVAPSSEDLLPAINSLGASMVGLRHIQQICHVQQRNNGWWDVDADGKVIDRNHGEIFALIISEVTEALDGDRKNKDDDHVAGRKNVEVELADAVCRIFDAAQAWGLDIAGALTDKLAYNADRADHKPENRAKEGGKKY